MRLRSLVRDHGPAPAKIGIATSYGRRIGRGGEANAVTMHPRERAWWSEDIPERETVPFFPCLAHFRTPGNQRGWFVVADPTLGLGVRPDGTASLPPYRTGVTEQAAVALGWIALIGVVLVMITGTGPGPFLFGVVVLLIAVPLLMRPSIRGIHRIADQRALARTRRLREPRSYVVTPDDAAAWRLCILAGKIAVTAPWQDRTIDIARQLPVLLWSGAGRCLTVDRRRRDAEAALAGWSCRTSRTEHEALQDIARTTLADVSDEARRLDAVEGHLTEILDASARLTQHRERMAAEDAIEKSRRAEERRLRQTLLHDAATGRAPEADDEADRTAGLSAEVTAVAHLLTASEIALRRTSTRN
ncbi:hypothetical protein [Pseudonocardia alni]|uniref:hypothetical protein n=1 Tax=Pseudonocardia alni TaxID=33907 RepID=UPI00280AF7B7|nr:hypothetical protein [Pseudonocardia alni]